MVDQTADVVHQHRQRRDGRFSCEGVDHLARGYRGNASLQAFLGRHDAEPANGVFSGCDIANKRDGHGPRLYTP